MLRQILSKYQKGRYHFYDRVYDGDWGGALPALPFKQKITENGNVVPRGNLSLARRTLGARRNNRLIFWEPMDTHVGETSERQAQGKNSRDL